MPLTWDASKVENLEELQNSKYWKVTAEFCFLLGTIGINKVTTDNWEEVATRCHIYEKLNGVTWSYWDKENGTEPYPITPEFVKRHIGYVTNNSNKTRAQFNTMIWNNAKEFVEMRITRLEQEN